MVSRSPLPPFLHLCSLFVGVLGVFLGGGGMCPLVSPVASPLAIRHHVVMDLTRWWPVQRLQSPTQLDQPTWPRVVIIINCDRCALDRWALPLETHRPDFFRKPTNLGPTLNPRIKWTKIEHQHQSQQQHNKQNCLLKSLFNVWPTEGHFNLQSSQGHCTLIILKRVARKVRSF